MEYSIKPPSETYTTEDVEVIYEPSQEEQAEFYEAVEVLRTLPTIAEKKEIFRRQIKEQVLSGSLNPLEFYRQRKIAIDCLEELGKDAEVLECAENEIAKYGKEKPTINGAVVTLGTRSTPNYASCDDPVYNKLKEELREREKFLKSLPENGITTVDPETGETISIKSPTYSSTTFITVKL